MPPCGERSARRRIAVYAIAAGMCAALMASGVNAAAADPAAGPNSQPTASPTAPAAGEQPPKDSGAGGPAATLTPGAEAPAQLPQDAPVPDEVAYVVQKPGGGIAVRTEQAADPEARADQLERRDDVVAASPNFTRTLLTVDDVGLSRQWALNALNATAVQSEADGTGQIVAIVDTGVDGKHPDLAGQLTTNGYNAMTKQVVPSRDLGDAHGHGTHVAGIVAAAANATGIRGVAPGAKILPIRAVSAAGSGSVSNIADGIRYATDHNASVINLSLGSYEPSAVEEAAVRYAVDHGVTVVAAAGNDGTEVPTYPAAYPASYDGQPAGPPIQGLIGVAALGINGKVAPYSTRGKHVDVAAPGSFVLSTLPRNRDSYGVLSGTSMAAPQVAGAVAILQSAKNGSLTPHQVEDLISASADDLGTTGWDNTSGHGAMRVDAALKRLGGVAVPTAARSISASGTVGADGKGTATVRVVIPAQASDSTVSLRVLTGTDAPDTASDGRSVFASIPVKAGEVRSLRVSVPNLNPANAYTFAAFIDNGTTASRSVTALWPTRFSVRGPTSVPWGMPANLYYSLPSPVGLLSGVSVTVRSRMGNAPWQELNSVLSDRATVALLGKRNTTVEFTATGQSGGVWPTSAPIRRLQVEPLVVLSDRSALRRGRANVFSGYVRPATKGIPVFIQRYERNGWTTIARTSTQSDGTFGAVWRPGVRMPAQKVMRIRAVAGVSPNAGRGYSLSSALSLR